MENLHDAVWLLCLFLIIFKHQYVPARGCITSERRALLDFKSLIVDNANRLSSWNTAKNCCNWDGITCNNLTGRVEKVDLRNPIQPHDISWSSSFSNIDEFRKNCLGGEINPSIRFLEHLRHLDLSSNKFSGIRIPKFIGSLRNLRYLNISGAGFDGEIPPHLGNLSQLRHLDIGQPISGLTHNTLSSKNLEWITRFSFLKSLDLSGINLSECLDWFDSVNMLPSLSSLNLRSCSLPVGEGLLPKFSNFMNLTSLVSLDMGQNYFSSTSELYLFFNLSSNLRLLRLDSNDFKGPFPFNMLENSRSLTVLDIHGNSFNSSTFMLDSLCNLSSLVVLDLSYNLLEGSLPLCLGKLTSLEILNLKMNKFGGKIPNELGDLKELTYLDLSSNSFNSSIPSSLGKLRKLEFLYLGGGNQLYGTVPSTLGQLSGLKELSISGNSLTGEISESHFMKLKLLKYLEFYGFVELIVNPQWIPPFQLRHIYINSVNMGNQFPPWLQTQQNVSLLILRNASISGPVPEWFGTTFSSVTDLDLSMNKMHGVLPSSMKNLRSLADVNLSENKLTGAITEWIGEELSQLQRLRLQSNSFYGVLPSSLKYFKHLYDLDLSDNQLTGIIPEWIGEVSQLEDLRLQSNRFNGQIPKQLCQLPYLQTLSLANNNLTGRVPDCLL